MRCRLIAPVGAWLVGGFLALSLWGERAEAAERATPGPLAAETLWQVASREPSPLSLEQRMGLLLRLIALPSGSAAPQLEEDQARVRRAYAELRRLLALDGKLDPSFEEQLLIASGTRGLLELAHRTEYLPDRTRFLVAAASSGHAPSEQADWEQAQLELAQLLLGQKLSTSRGAAIWLLERAGERGRTLLAQQQAALLPLRKNLGARSTTGLAFPRTEDCDELAQQVFGESMLGTCWNLSKDSEVAGEYLLVGERASYWFPTQAPHPEAAPPRLVSDANALSEVRSLSFALVAFTRDQDDLLAVELRSEPAEWSLPASDECMSLPLPAGEDSMQPMAAYGGLVDAQWMDLSKGLLALDLIASEGYAGGGASFHASWLILAQDQVLRPLTCIHRSMDAMYGGDWHPDGTREHPSRNESWEMELLPRAGTLPELRFSWQHRKRFSHTLSWNPSRETYVLSHKERKEVRPSPRPKAESRP